jgi:CheY-like chemotaxis protein
VTDATGAPDRAAHGRVLVVEDDEHIRELVVLHLELEGHTAVALGDGAEALARARAEPFAPSGAIHATRTLRS